MSHIRIDKQKALKKWAPVLENMGVASEDRLYWMSEYAEFHSINENAYVNATLAGMGSVLSPQPSTFAGYTNPSNATGQNYGGLASGSGDLGQNLLPVAMKIAAQTIGLDLVAVKPSPGPKIDLLYIDFQYDDVQNPSTTGRPQVFKITDVSTATLAAVKANISGNLAANQIRSTSDGLQGGRMFMTVATGSIGTFWQTAGAVSQTAPSSAFGGAVEFLGFSRIDGAPIFRSYRQANSERTVSPSYAYTFDPSQNTFTSPTASMRDQIVLVGTVSVTAAVIDLVSALEDHLPIQGPVRMNTPVKCLRIRIPPENEFE